MFRDYSKHLGVLGGALALLTVGTIPVSASTNTCPTGSSASFTGTTVWLGQDVASLAPTTPIWRGTVNLHAFCGVDDSAHWLSNVELTGVYATSNGTIPNLEASADGVNYTVLPLQGFDPGLPFPSVPLATPPGLVTDDQGNVQFTLYAQSPDTAMLAAPDGGTQVIGMQLDAGRGVVTSAGGGGSPVTFRVGGFGDVFAATPELDSLALFGTGAAAMAGYAMLRMRARGTKRD